MIDANQGVLYRTDSTSMRNFYLSDAFMTSAFSIFCLSMYNNSSVKCLRVYCLKSTQPVKIHTHTHTRKIMKTLRTINVLTIKMTTERATVASAMLWLSCARKLSKYSNTRQGIVINSHVSLLCTCERTH